MELRTECGRCRIALSGDDPAYHCALECTYCATCVRALAFVCPNCSGELVRRPRPAPHRERPLRKAGTTQGTLRVREASSSDVPALTPLFDGYRQFYEQAPDPAASGKFLSDRLARHESRILIAEDHGRPVGFVQLYPLFSSISVGPIFVLNDLFVDPKCRRAGVGAELLRASRELAVAAGAHYLTLSTAVDNPAQRLYESMGWKLDRGFLYYELPLR